MYGVRMSVLSRGRAGSRAASVRSTDRVVGMLVTKSRVRAHDASECIVFNLGADPTIIHNLLLPFAESGCDLRMQNPQLLLSRRIWRSFQGCPRAGERFRLAACAQMARGMCVSLFVVFFFFCVPSTIANSQFVHVAAKCGWDEASVFVKPRTVHWQQTGNVDETIYICTYV